MSADCARLSLPAPLGPAGASDESLVVRRADTADHAAILDLLHELDLDYPSRDLERFHVGEISKRIVAIAELKDFGDLYLLSCVGVRADAQGAGFGRAFVNLLVQGVTRDVHLFTVVPEFFMKAGFVAAESDTASLRLREMYDCADCHPALCHHLVRKLQVP